MTNPDPDGLLTDAPILLSEVCEMWDAQVKGTASFRPEIDAEQAVGIHTLTHHAVRTSKAILKMRDAGLTLEYMPQVRMVMECAVTAAWLLFTPGAGKALVREGARQRVATLKGIEASNTLAEVQASHEFLKSLELPGGVSVEDRCKSLIDGAELYTFYRVASGYCHAGLGLFDHYAVKKPDEQIGVAFNRVPDFDNAPVWIGFATSMLLLTLKANDEARRESVFSDKLDEFSARLGVAHKLQKADGTFMPPRIHL